MKLRLCNFVAAYAAPTGFEVYHLAEVAGFVLRVPRA